MRESTSVTYNQLITELSKSAHGELSEYVQIGLLGAAEQSDFFSHLIAYNERKGQIRDSKVALPIISLSCGTYPIELVDNSLAHLALLSPRDLLRAYNFAKAIKLPGHMKSFKRMVDRYLNARATNWGWFQRTALQHRNSLAGLYRLNHTKRSEAVGAILFGGEGSKRKGGFRPVEVPSGTVFNTVANLKSMQPNEIAGEILGRKIPFLTALGALGGWGGEEVNEPVVVLALMDRMSDSEFITHIKDLEKHGTKTNPGLRDKFEQKLARAGGSKKVTFKTTRALETMEEDNPYREKLKAVQEKQIEALGGIEGNWAVLGDKSGSMQHAIEVSKMVAGTLARMVKGTVKLVFFDNNARGIDVTGKTYDEIKRAVMGVQAQGGTSVGVALECIMDNNFEVDGIAIVSDCAENNHPRFAAVYREYCKKYDRKVPVYVYLVSGTDNPQHTQDFFTACKAVELVPQVFDYRNQQIDFYSLPDVIRTMRVSRHSLVEEIFATPLTLRCCR